VGLMVTVLCTPDEHRLIVGQPVEYDVLDNAWVDGVRRPDLDHLGREQNRAKFVGGATRLVVPGIERPVWEGDVPKRGHFFPDPRWVDATGPCPTCGGYGILSSSGPIDDHQACPNPDCIDGRKRVALAVTCPGDDLTCPHPDCRFNDCDGSVVFAHATVEVLPVGHPYEPLPAGSPWFCASGTDYGYVIDADGGARGSRLMLAPDLRSDFVVALDNVEMA
jgi:hypothetical protein